MIQNTLKRIAIVGPESTGKTTLAKKLAEHYHTAWVPEYAREYLGSINHPYTYDDLLTIAKGQLAEEDRKATEVQDLLICDTNLVVIKVWCDFKYGKCHEWIEQGLKSRQYDLHLLMGIDFPWVADPQREHPESREELFEIYKRVLDNLGVNYTIISGQPQERVGQAIQAIGG